MSMKCKILQSQCIFCEQISMSKQVPLDLLIKIWNGQSLESFQDFLPSALSPLPPVVRLTPVQLESIAITSDLNAFKPMISNIWEAQPSPIDPLSRSCVSTSDFLSMPKKPIVCAPVRDQLELRSGMPKAQPVATSWVRQAVEGVKRSKRPASLSLGNVHPLLSRIWRCFNFHYVH